MSTEGRARGTSPPRERSERGGAVRGKAYPTGVRLTEIEMVNHAEKLTIT